MVEDLQNTDKIDILCFTETFIPKGHETMVRITHVLSRVPVIKFRKGSGASAPRAPPATSGSAAAPQQTQPSAAMSGGPISDIDLPARYRRLPLSQDEIDHINGGGVV
ncbi:unnamed protein product [Leptidea sinapis]|uniref:28S ribosomal protein S36, mitochondrial n=2 Tax=Leptidea sinapis TaxID=189913 RepID=A0A5E4PL29_9NEOP|nr:unnamed protein product [Leptidea sinapis]